MSTLMFWNKQNGNANQNGNENGTSNGKNGKKTWLHAPDSLVNGHVAYLVKFLGSTPVDQAKGIDTVKDAIRRLQFSQQIKKAESGSNLKIKKVEITISVDGVAVQEPRGTKILHQFPLHNISYCADEKGVKKFFSFIAKTNASNVPNGGGAAVTDTSGAAAAEETHECFVFISSKLASDITLTIGQAFELAYRRYMTESGKTPELSKLQTQKKLLENQLSAYRQRIKDLTEHVAKSELDRILVRHGLRDILELPQLENGIDAHMANINGSNTPDLGIDVSSPNNDDQLLIETSDKHFAPIVPPRNLQNQISSTLDALKPSVGTKLEGLLLNSDSDSDFDPRADENDTIPNDKHSTDSSFFGFEPPKTTVGQQLFATNAVATNGINAMHQNGNGIITSMSNGISNNHSSPPLLAPPPKASIPRRSGNNTSASQDLFGSTPFDAPLQPSPFDVGSTQIATSLSASPTSSSSGSFQTVNQFNESSLDENILSDLKAFTVNADKLDSAFSFSHSVDHAAPKLQSSPPQQQQQQPPQPSNPFLMSPGFGEIPKSTESAKSLSTMTGKSYNINYDAFRDTFTTSEFNAIGQADVMPPMAQKPAISMDLFRDAAAAAFSEFGTSNGKKHEFFNKMPNVIGQGGKTFNNNNNNNNKSMGFSADDFTLESLDPLRK